MANDTASIGTSAPTDDASSAADALDITSTAQNLSAKQVQRHSTELGLPTEVKASLKDGAETVQPVDPGSTQDI